MKTQETENNYSQLIQEILQKDWKKFLKLMRVLKYNSPGEYLRLFYEDEKLFLESNDHYLRSNFIIRKNNLIIGKTIPWPITDWRPLFIRKVLFFKYEKLFNELHSEIRKQEFLNPINSTIDLELKIIQYKRLFQFLLSRKNMYFSKVQLEIEDMNTLLEQRLLLDQKTPIDSKFISKQSEKAPSGEPPFYYQIDGIKIKGKRIDTTRKLNRLGKFLVQEGFINEEDFEAFICLFSRKDKRVDFKHKVVWNSDQLALIFLIKSLMAYDVIKDEHRMSKKISLSFLNSERKPISNLSLHTQTNELKFHEITKSGIANWVENNKNKQILKIYKELRKLYFNLIEEL